MTPGVPSGGRRGEVEGSVWQGGVSGEPPGTGPLCLLFLLEKQCFDNNHGAGKKEKVLFYNVCK